MRFKLIVALVEDQWTAALMEAAREAGAKGSTVISNAKGEGLEVAKTFLGMSLESTTDILLFLVEEHQSRSILEVFEQVGDMKKPKTGIAFQVDVEDAVGVSHQIQELKALVDDEIV